jgi:hypothetical protein
MKNDSEAAKKKKSLKEDKIAKPAHPTPMKLSRSCRAQQLLLSSPPIITASHLFEERSGSTVAIDAGWYTKAEIILK